MRIGPQEISDSDCDNGNSGYPLICYRSVMLVGLDMQGQGQGLDSQGPGQGQGLDLQGQEQG